MSVTSFKETFLLDVGMRRTAEGHGWVRAFLGAVGDVAAWTGRRAWCVVRGHAWVDDDPGDPEYGPDPDVYCERCWRSM